MTVVLIVHCWRGLIGDCRTLTLSSALCVGKQHQYELSLAMKSEGI